METSPPPPLLVKAIVYTQVLSSCLTAFRSPLTPLYKGGTRIKVPLFKGDLGGSDHLCVHRSLVKERGDQELDIKPRRLEYCYRNAKGERGYTNKAHLRGLNS